MVKAYLKIDLGLSKQTYIQYPKKFQKHKRIYVIGFIRLWYTETRKTTVAKWNYFDFENQKFWIDYYNSHLLFP